MKLEHKTAFVTGGNSGIGLATARRFVAEGARVTITGRNQERLDAAARELGPNLLAIRADVTDLDANEKAILAAVKAFGNLDIVFANAGIGGPTPLGETSFAVFDEILRTNLTSVFFTVQAALPYLNDGASLIFNGSIHAVVGTPRYSAYAASKAGLRAMVRVLASELSPRRIRVNIVLPGATRTPIWSKRAPTPEAMEALEKRLGKGIPLVRMSEADEIAKAVLFLASDDASNMQAAELVVDGGQSGAPGGAPVYRAP